ncbi:RidA family protein [Leucobacter sp.]
MKTFIRPNEHGPSAGVITDRFVFTAASAIDPATRRRAADAVTVRDEVRIVLERLRATLEEAGLGLDDLTKITVWLSEERYRFEFIPAYVEFMPGAPYPSRGLFTIGLVGDARIQIEAIAARPAARSARPEISHLAATGSDAFSAGVDFGDLVYADATALDAPSLTRAAGTDRIADETDLVLDRLAGTLQRAGLGLEDVAKANCYLSDDTYRDEFWAAFDARFPGVKPVRLTQVCELAGEARVLVDAIAAR